MQGLEEVRRYARTCVRRLLARDGGCGEIRPHDVAIEAAPRTALRAVQAATTRDARHSEGNDQSYLEDLKRRKGADADQPHRIAFKKLVRA